MSDNKLVKAIMDATTLTGLAAGIGWISKKVVKETFTNDPSSNVMNYAKFTDALQSAPRLRINSARKAKILGHVSAK